MPTKPKAYLNYLFFDEAMKVVAEESGALQVTQANAWSDLTKPIFPINRNGFVYVYSCNNSEAIVRTDNLLVVHYTGRLLEEFHYYPFGLCFEVSKSPALEKSSEQRYNSQFIQQDEFVDANGQTYGMEDYDFAFRNYDPQIGRWIQPDPLMQHASPYLAMSNNPVLFTDPSGLWDGPTDHIGVDANGNIVAQGYAPGKNHYYFLTPTGRGTWNSYEIDESDFFYYRQFQSIQGGASVSSQVTDIHGKIRNEGDAYGRGNYWANELARQEAQKNSGFNSKLVTQIGGAVNQAGFGADEHWIGPALIGLGQPINYLKPLGALGSSPGSSIASKTLSKVIPYSSPFIKKSTTFLFGRASSTAVLGRALGRFVPALGWGLTTYDLWDNREKINEFIQEQRKTNETHKDDLIWHVR